MFDGIGSTADEVADTLRKLHIRGVPNTVASLNPLVKYVSTAILVDAMMVDVSKGLLTLTFRDYRTDVIQLPPVVVDFLLRFNRGDYPDLIMDLKREL